MKLVRKQKYRFEEWVTILPDTDWIKDTAFFTPGMIYFSVSEVFHLVIFLTSCSLSSYRGGLSLHKKKKKEKNFQLNLKIRSLGDEFSDASIDHTDQGYIYYCGN